MRGSSLVALVTGLGLVGSVGAAHATVYIGLQEAGYFGGKVQSENYVTTLGIGQTSYSYNSGLMSFGTFKNLNISATVSNGTSSVESAFVSAVHKAGNTKPLSVFITFADIPALTGTDTADYNFSPPSSLTKGFQVVESEYVDLSNSHLSTAGAQIGSVTYTGIGGNITTAGTQSGTYNFMPASLYSITQEYVFNPLHAAGNEGGANMVTNISAVPEASTWAMMALGFMGLGFAGFYKKRERVVVS